MTTSLYALGMVANGDRQRAEQGLHEALDRFEARASDSSLGDPLVPFAEALNWAYSLEEWHEAQLGRRAWTITRSETTIPMVRSSLA
jgi:hypothetical protein